MENELIGEAPKNVTQQVNLMRFIPKEQKVYLPTALILQLCLIFILILTGYSFYIFRQATSSAKRIVTLQDEQKILTESIAKLSLTETREYIGADVVSKILHEHRNKNGSGFSDYLAAISKASNDHIWLTSISIQKNNNDTLLAGLSFHSDDAVQFMENLNKNPFFAAKPFYLLKVEKAKPSPQDKRDLYSFVLKTQMVAAG